jgi:predicted CXXCH cytochrome family protein
MSAAQISSHWKFAAAAFLVLAAASSLAAPPAKPGRGAVAKSIASPNVQLVANSKHNLSANGPGTVKSASEGEICIFCHAPHGGTKDAPLWNRFASAATYTPYSSTTMKARPGQPTGASKLCLSCHDGTVAMGQMISRPSVASVKMAGGATTMSASSPGYVGPDLSDDHPVSFVYDKTLARQNGQLSDPSALPPAVKLDKDSQLQCTSCHDPHSNRFGKFLVEDNTGSKLCAECHDLQYWQNSVHRTSSATWNGTQPDPWPHTSLTTVSANACENCHRPHTAGTKEQLLNFFGEEQNCYPCHNGHVAAKNIQAEFQKISAHPVSLTTGVHTPVENPVGAPRHVECEDCHNSHAAVHSPAAAPAASGSLAGARGVGAGGSEVNPAKYEYEICFRCHGDSAPKNASHVNRVSQQTNTRLEFDPSNISFHPVEAASHASAAPSLRGPYNISSLIYCSDCHNSDKGPGAGGTGPNGPHGSAFVPLLERQLSTTDFSSENANAYALCYKCHDRASILGDVSFKYHRLHVVEQQTACTTCHDSHGAGSTGLINFNSDYVKPLNGQLSWVTQGNFEGTCTLVCHGSAHDQLSTLQQRRLMKSLSGQTGKPAAPGGNQVTRPHFRK